MDCCFVCGRELGFWAKLSGVARTGICKSCGEEGRARLDGVVRSVHPDSDFKALWDRFHELARQYRVPDATTDSARVLLIDGIAEAISGKERVEAADVNYLASLGTYQQGRKPGPRLLTAVARINRRVNIDTWNPQDPPRVECKALLLQASEFCHWEEPARLFEQRTRRVYVGGSQGVSIRLMRGVRYHVGAFAGAPIDTTYLSDAGEGTLHVTNQRVGFTGAQQSFAVPWKKVINLAGFADGLAIHRSGAKKPYIMQIPHPDLTLQIMALASPSPND